MKNCPHCKQEIQSAAILCRHCKKMLSGAAAQLVRLPETSGKAIASFTLNFIGFSFYWWWFSGIWCLLALIFGYQARRDIRHSNGALTGTGLATTGMIFGVLGMIVYGGLIFVILNTFFSGVGFSF